jgi:predicted permease
VQTALLIVPNFVLILAGLLLARGFDYGRAFWEGLERLVYYVLFPALLFRSLAVSPLDLGSMGKVVASACAFTVLGMGLGWLAKPVFGLEPRLAASCTQCAFRFNTYVGLAVAGSVFGAQGVASAALVFGAMIPVANLGAVAFLAAHSERRYLAELVRNPLILATLSGFAWHISGMPVPGFADQTLNLLGQTALPAGLLSVGAALRIERGRGSPGAHAWWLAVKLGALPLVAWAMIHSLGLSGMEAAILLLAAALPTASSAYILAVRMGGDGGAVATQITVGTVISMLTIPAWLALVR